MTQHFMVTGGMGFIGHHVTKRLSDLGNNVRIVDPAHMHGLLATEDVKNINHDRCVYMGGSGSKHGDMYLFYNGITRSLFSCYDRIRCVSYMDQTIMKNSPTTIIHLASYPNARMSRINPARASSDIVTCTAAMAELARKHNCRFVHISSSMVYGDWQDTVSKVSHEPRPKCIYGSLKYQAELMVKEIIPEAVILRPSAVYGPRDYNNRVVEKMIVAALKGMPIHVNGKDNILDITYVDDVAEGIIQAAESEVSGVYNLSAGCGIGLHDLAKTVVRLTNSNSEIMLNPHEDQYPIRGAQDISESRSDFGFDPVTDVESGLIKTISWVKGVLDARKIHVSARDQ